MTTSKENQIEDDFNKKHLNGRRHKKKYNFNQQHRQPDQHNNQKYISTIKKSTLIGCDIIVN